MLLKDKRVIILLLMLVIFCINFWLSSRYPSLDAKAMMAGSLEMDDGLSFDAWLVHQSGQPWWQTGLITFANWLHTNRQGMVFGLIIALIIMTLLPLLIRSLKNKPRGISASLLGALMGTPLGICVNCAAPLAFAMYQRGARAETALSAMISSPTLNVVVLTMLFSLFTWPLILIKLMFTSAVILIVIPILARLFNDESELTTLEKSNSELFNNTENHQNYNLIEAIKWVAKSLLNNGWYLIIKVIPLMLLAGLIGSLVITLLPWDELISHITDWDRKGKLIVLIALIGIAFIGLLLPVPMAFDVIICITLLNIGVPVKYVAVLLFTLGSFSIYSFFIIWQSGMRKIAIVLTLCLASIGVLSGVASHYLSEWYSQYTLNNIYTLLSKPDAKRHEVVSPTIIKTKAEQTPSLIYASRDENAKPANVEFIKLLEKTNTSTQWKMQEITNTKFSSYPITLIDRMSIPMNHMGSLAAGDINNDNWVDFLVGSTQGLFLYMNNGNGFDAVRLPFQDDVMYSMASIALIDFNNDGWLDIFYSQLDRGSVIRYSDKGTFTTPLVLNNKDNLASFSASFGDIDHNGELDILHSNYSTPHGAPISKDGSRNRLFMQFNQHFKSKDLPGIPGETLTTLLSDINNDSWLDVFIGNDFNEADTYYMGKGDGTLEAWPDTKTGTTKTTMSIDSADIDNDLQLETYHVQITRNPTSPPFAVPQIGLEAYYKQNCASEKRPLSLKCDSLNARLHTHKHSDPNHCLRLPEDQTNDCLAAFWRMNALQKLIKEANPEKRLAPLYPSIASRLKSTLRQPYDYNEEQPGMPQQRRKNQLQRYDFEAGSNDPMAFTTNDNAENANISISGWGWNAKFADLDGDQWQDIFLVNGWGVTVQYETSNVWYKNQRDGTFKEQSKESGLRDFDGTKSYLYLDHDNDGDLDIITFNGIGELKHYENLSTTSSNHIQFELNDHVGNKNGIGSKIIIYYSGNKSQLREIKASGGYLSQDASIVHFGLGNNKEVKRVEVQWSTGETTSYHGKFNSNHRYRLNRYQ